MVWAKKLLIAEAKPFYLIIIHLTDPEAANQEIHNHVCFKNLLKVTERST